LEAPSHVDPQHSHTKALWSCRASCVFNQVQNHPLCGHTTLGGHGSPQTGIGYHSSGFALELASPTPAKAPCLPTPVNTREEASKNLLGPCVGFVRRGDQFCCKKGTLNKRGSSQCGSLPFEFDNFETTPQNFNTWPSEPVVPWLWCEARARAASLVAMPWWTSLPNAAVSYCTTCNELSRALYCDMSCVCVWCVGVRVCVDLYHLLNKHVPSCLGVPTTLPLSCTPCICVLADCSYGCSTFTCQKYEGS
jgi:hypothetical protein